MCEGNPKGINKIIMSNLGTFLVTIGNDKYIRLFNNSTSVKEGEFIGNDNVIRDLDISSDDT